MFQKICIFFSIYLIYWELISLFQIILSYSLVKEVFSVLVKSTEVTFYWERFLKEESALLSKSNLNETVSVKVAHVCSWHIIYHGTLFNGPSLLAQLGSKMVCKRSSYPGSSFHINARMAIITNPFVSENRHLKYGLGFNWKIVKRTLILFLWVSS